MKRGPIGVFDSGLGGLTAVKELRLLLPREDIVYFGDTARLPYGTRGRDTIITYARQDIAFLLSKNVKTLLAACGTISSTLPQAETDALPVRYAGVVGAAAAAAARATRNKRVGIIGTEATIASNSYQLALAQLDGGITATANPGPLFVSLVENGHFAPHDPFAKLAAELYLKPLKEAGVDTLIMGCTHYPLLADTIAQEMGPSVSLIDPGKEAALVLKDSLAENGLLTDSEGPGRMEYYVTDDPSRFGYYAGLFLGEDASGPVERINVEAYSLA